MALTLAQRIAGAAQASPEEEAKLRSYLVPVDTGIYRQNQKLRGELVQLRQELDVLSNKNVQLVFELRSLQGDRQKVADLEQKMREAARTIEQLRAELRIERKHRETLEQRLQQLNPPKPPALPSARLLELLECPLGLMARTLVQQAFERSGVSLETRQPRALARVLAKLEKTAPRLATCQDNLQGVAQGLAVFRKEFQVPANDTVADLLPQPAGKQVALPQSASNPEPAPNGAALLESLASRPAVEARPSPPVGSALQSGFLLLEQNRHQEALEHFQTLIRKHPESPLARLGLFHSLARNRHFGKAHQVGRPLLTQFDGPKAQKLREALAVVTQQLLEQTRSTAKRKRLMLEMSQLHEDKQVALGFLRQADQMEDRIQDEAEIAFELCRLLEDNGPERVRYFLKALRGVTDRPQLFEWARELFNHPNQQAAGPVARTILTLLRRPRAQAEFIQRKSGGELSPRAVRGLQNYDWQSPLEAAVVKFCLDRLGETARLDLTCPRFKARMARSTPAPAGSKVTETVLEAARFLGLERLRVSRCEEGPPFLIDASNVPTPTVVYHQSLESLEPGEIRFLVYRKLVQLKRRHLELFRASRNLEFSQAVTLTRHLLQQLADDEALPDIEACLVEFDSAAGNAVQLEDLLGRLYLETAHDAFWDLKEFCFAERPFSQTLDELADQFAARAGGLVASSYALVRCYDEHRSLMPASEQRGLIQLYQTTLPGHVQRRLQSLWAHRLEEALQATP